MSTRNKRIEVQLSWDNNSAQNRRQAQCSLHYADKPDDKQSFYYSFERPVVDKPTQLTISVFDNDEKHTINTVSLSAISKKEIKTEHRNNSLANYHDHPGRWRGSRVISPEVIGETFFKYTTIASFPVVVTCMIWLGIVGTTAALPIAVNILLCVSMLIFMVSAFTYFRAAAINSDNRSKCHDVLVERQVRDAISNDTNVGQLMAGRSLDEVLGHDDYDTDPDSDNAQRGSKRLNFDTGFRYLAEILGLRSPSTTSTIQAGDGDVVQGGSYALPPADDRHNRRTPVTSNNSTPNSLSSAE